MKLSVVATIYQSEAYIVEFYQRISKVASGLVGDDYEIVLVDDGSPDNGLQIAATLADIDSHLVVVELSRNFGHHKAMMTGLAHAKGDKIFLIDTDLEEDPEWLIDFSAFMKSQSCDVVYGVQNGRKGGWFERWSGQLFYKFFRILTGLRLPENIVTSRLMTRSYVESLLLHDEREVFMAGLWHITGYIQKPYLIKKSSSSKSTYTFRKKMSLFINSVTSFSNAPLIGIFYIGVFISILAMLYIVYLLIHWGMLYKPLSGWTSVIASVWLLGGLIISFIGVVGIYLAKIFSEVKRRPYTLVRQIYVKK